MQIEILKKYAPLKSQSLDPPLQSVILTDTRLQTSPPPPPNDDTPIIYSCVRAWAVGAICKTLREFLLIYSINHNIKTSIMDRKDHMKVTDLPTCIGQSDYVDTSSINWSRYHHLDLTFMYVLFRDEASVSCLIIPDSAACSHSGRYLIVLDNRLTGGNLAICSVLNSVIMAWE